MRRARLAARWRSRPGWRASRRSRLRAARSSCARHASPTRRTRRRTSTSPRSAARVDRVQRDQPRDLRDHAARKAQPQHDRLGVRAAQPGREAQREVARQRRDHEPRVDRGPRRDVGFDAGAAQQRQRGRHARRQQQRLDLAAHAFPRDAAQRSARFLHGGLDRRVGFQSERGADARRAQRAQRILAEALARGADGAQSSRGEILRAAPGIDDRAARGVPGDRVHGEVAVREVVVQRRTGAVGGDVERAGRASAASRCRAESRSGRLSGRARAPLRAAPTSPRRSRRPATPRSRSRTQPPTSHASCPASRKTCNASRTGSGNGFGAKRTRHRAQSTRAIAQEPGRSLGYAATLRAGGCRWDVVLDVSWSSRAAASACADTSPHRRAAAVPASW